jgi:hypothetical protein
VGLRLEPAPLTLEPRPGVVPSQVGFHTFDYARHFLSCCSRMLGLDFQSKRGSIALEYFGRSVQVRHSERPTQPNTFSIPLVALVVHMGVLVDHI